MLAAGYPIEFISSNELVKVNKKGNEKLPLKVKIIASYRFQRIKVDVKVMEAQLVNSLWIFTSTERNGVFILDFE
ncbi:MAG TPA: hypothetical protein VE944_31590 [Nostoc sp.]|uniref:hypothetical protein n=1 Tax=Nostoc sp. TaxID=1180 RepID=UPI002D665856|nr:hypothetical protein [Nostoc sp.]HYX18835.1 hypothetical protein [Nostoc sp.]